MSTPSTFSPPPPFPVHQARNGLGTASLVLGIIGVLSGLIPLLFWLAGILAVLALVFGLIGVGRARKGQATNKKTAIWGTSLGAVAAVLAVVGLVITVTAVDDAVNSLKGTGGKKESSADRDSKGSDELGFGDTFAYDDGMKVTVAKPAAYSPGDSAVGHKKGNKAVQVRITVVNRSKDKVDLSLSTVHFKDANGAEAEQIYDDGMPKEFSGKLRPGKQAVATYAVSLPADAASSLEADVEPGFLDYEDASWTGTVK
ncbi:DUF4190 domain-containing protein [Actinomycetota bacterium Odt1-20B]